MLSSSAVPELKVNTSGYDVRGNLASEVRHKLGKFWKSVRGCFLR